MDLNKLKKDVEDNPMGAIAVAAALLASVAKVIDAVSATQGRRAYAKQVKHRISKKKS